MFNQTIMPELKKIEALSDSVKEYVLLNYDIVKLEITRKSSEIGSSIFSALMLGIALFLFAFALSMGVGFYLSALLGDTFSGFGIIAGFYLLISIILLIGRKKLIEKPLRNKIIRKLLGNKTP
jgi:hypothetical protein